MTLHIGSSLVSVVIDYENYHELLKLIWPQRVIPHCMGQTSWANNFERRSAVLESNHKIGRLILKVSAVHWLITNLAEYPEALLLLKTDEIPT